MKLINSIGPNPQVVRTFAAEKGITLQTETIDIMKGENRQAPYLKKNPAGGSPCLELDNGAYISEITAICEYLEDKFPAKPLIGSTPEEKAETRMWTRRIDLNICEPLANGFRYSEGLPMFKTRMTTLPDAAEGLKRLAQEKITWIDGLIAGREFICGNASDARRHPALLVPELRHASGPAAERQEQEHQGLVRPDGGSPQRQSLSPTADRSVRMRCGAQPIRTIAP